MTINLTDPQAPVTDDRLRKRIAELRRNAEIDRELHLSCLPHSELELAIAEELLATRAELQEHRKSEEREKIRAAHAAWSDKAFGSVGPIGPLKHLSKEALEAVAEPGDLSEWADMQFLLWDAQRRAGITDEQITQAMVEKLAVNESRTWPEPKDGEPRFHVKSDAEKNRSGDE